MKRLKNKAVPSKNTTQKKNNGGMTYIELLVALSILVLVVTMFSPMLLNSYDRIYRAGEITSDAFDARFEMEDGLATREDHTLMNIGTNFITNSNTLLNTVNVKARQVISSLSGLETLYSGGRGVLKIVSDTLVKDNQSAHTVRIRLTNLEFNEYTILTSKSALDSITSDPTTITNKVAFYITSVFDNATPLTGVIVNKPNFKTGADYFPFVDILIKNIDITYSPIRFTAYYLNDFGVLKEASTYLVITEADMIFVGETTEDADYFTFSDAGSIETPIIAGRKMYTAPIGSDKVLTDVSYNFISDSGEGFYAMCGEDGIARRLWHLNADTLADVELLDDTAVNKGAEDKVSMPEIIYKHTTLGGTNTYYQYDWAGDMTDLMAFTCSTDTDGTLGYGSSSTADMDFGNSDYIWKNEYNVDNTYFAYNFDGFNAGHGEYRDNHRRISYIITTTEDNLKAKYGVEPIDGFIMYKHEKEGFDHNGVDDLKEKRYVYNFTNNKWYTFRVEQKIIDWSLKWVIKAVDDTDANFNGLVSGLVNDENKQVSEGIFVSRNWAAVNNIWATDNEVEAEQSYDEKLAYVYLKSFNTISPDTLASKNLVQARSNTSSAKVNFTSCSVLPGTIESLYLGTLDSYGIVNETKGVIAAPGNSGLTQEQGMVSAHVLINDDDKTYLKNYDQKATINVGTALANGGKLGVTPSPSYGRDSYATEYTANKTVHTGWENNSDLRFTMGYSSDLYAMYQNLNARDMRPLESVYAATYNKSDNGGTDSDYRHNMWFPREFLNVIESDTYGSSMLAVGYDVGGTSKLYYEASPEYTTSTDTKYLYGNRDMDLDNDGTVDWLEGNDLVTESMVSNAENKGLFYKTFSYNGQNYYILDPAPGEGEGSQTMLSLPKHIVTSTVVDGFCNNGVIAVYNAPTGRFVHIGYIKGSKDNNVRLNCVSMDMLNEDASILGAAIGGSDGKVYLALLGYDDNGMIGEAPLVWGSTLLLLADYTSGFSSIESVKAFKNGDDFCVLVGGRGKTAGDNTLISLITIEDCDLSKVNHDVQILVPNAAYDITDLIIAEDYIYLTAHDYNKTHGAIGYCPLTTNGVIDVSADNWTFIGDYYTNFTTDKTSGELVVDASSKKGLPPLRALASTMTSIS